MLKLTDNVSINFKRCQEPDLDPDFSYLQQQYADEPPAEAAKYRARLAAYHRGEWEFRGLFVRAEITVSRPGWSTSYKFESAGVWGIESDCGTEHEKDTWDSEEAELRADLKVMGAGLALL